MVEAGRRNICMAGLFPREARALAKMNHPHIFAVSDFGPAGSLCYLYSAWLRKMPSHAGQAVALG